MRNFNFFRELSVILITVFFLVKSASLLVSSDPVSPWYGKFSLCWVLIIKWYDVSQSVYDGHKIELVKKVYIELEYYLVTSESPMLPLSEVISEICFGWR